MPTPISYRSALARIGEMSLPLKLSSFASYPSRLSQFIRATRNPQPNRWSKVGERRFNGLPGGYSTDTVQGFATDGISWFVPVTEGGDNHQAWVHQLDVKFGYIKSFNVTSVTGRQHHVGDIDFFDNKFYLPLQAGGVGPMVLVLNSNLDVLHYGLLVDNTDGMFGSSPLGLDINPWCAINPWNRLYYTSNFGGSSEHESPVTICYAFDPLNNFTYLPQRNIVLKGADVRSAQGGKFDKNGHLLISSSEYKDIRVFSAINGFFFGSCGIDEADWDELEGFCLWPIHNHDGDSQIQIASVVTGVNVGSVEGILHDLYWKYYRVVDWSLLT
jgi:hypothetical protein